MGQNVDTAGENGVGKSGIINAICYALYNNPFDNISLQKLLNQTNATKNTLMEVRICFSVNDDYYEIYRCRGESYNISITMNNEDITKDSVAENDKAIKEIIGISYELFTKIIIFSGNSTPFLMMPVSQQRLQIEELFNITILTEKAVKLKEVIRETENNIAIQHAIIKQQESQVQLFQEQLDEAQNRVKKWDTDKIENLARLEKQRDSLSSVNIQEEKEIHKMTELLENEHRNLSSSFNLIKKDKNALTTDIKKLKDELDHLLNDKCPYCLQGFLGAQDKLTEKKELLSTKQNKLSEVEFQITDSETSIKDLSEQISLAKSVMKFSSLAEAIKAETASQTAQDKIDTLQQSINPHIEALEQIKKIVIAEVNYDKINELKKDLEHQQFLLKLLTDKNSFVRRKIINKTIPFLNGRLIFYTKELGLPHIVKFDDDMSCTVSEYGRELDFGNLSSGEKKRVNLSLSLAFRDVLHHLHNKVNCLFIDEIDASLDTSGVENVFKLLKQKSRDDKLGLWIISHRPEAIGRFDRTIIVRKENGFSTILDENGDELGE